MVIFLDVTPTTSFCTIRAVPWTGDASNVSIDSSLCGLIISAAGYHVYVISYVEWGEVVAVLVEGLVVVLDKLLCFSVRSYVRGHRIDWSY